MRRLGLGLASQPYSGCWVHGAYRPFTSADRANASSWHELWERVNRLEAQLQYPDGQRYAAVTDPLPVASPIASPIAAPPRDQRSWAYNEALGHQLYIGDELMRSGVQWIMGDAYVGLWRRLHRAEEILIEAGPPPPDEVVIAGALYDEMRIDGSNLGNADELLAKLRQAVYVMDPVNSMRYLGRPPSVPLTPTASLSSPSSPPALLPLSVPPSPSDKGEARAILRDVRRALNDFRDDRWDGLVRSRNALLLATFALGLATCLLLVLAIILLSTNITRDAIIVATSFFLAGAAAGLLKRTLTGTDAVVDDFGLSTARLILVPIASGLAAIGGVLFLPLLLNVATAIAPPPPTPSPTTTQATPASQAVAAPPPVLQPAVPATQVFMGTAFTLENLTTLNILLAAVVGVTPDLILNVLLQQAARYKDDLKTSGASEQASSSR
jgi:hypothetical protein